MKNKKDTIEITLSAAGQLNGLTVVEVNSVLQWLQYSLNDRINQQTFSDEYLIQKKEYLLKLPKRELELYG